MDNNDKPNTLPPTGQIMEAGPEPSNTGVPAGDNSSISVPQEVLPTEPTITYGMKAVGLSFNPGQNQVVYNIKAMYAEIIDHLNDARFTTEDPETKRLFSIAITEAQAAQMWAVKAITWS